MRSTAGAISALVALLLIVPNLIGFLGAWADPLVKIMPSNAGESFVTSTQVAGTLTPGVGIGVLGVWAAAAFAAAAALVRRRDA